MFIGESRLRHPIAFSVLFSLLISVLLLILLPCTLHAQLPHPSDQRERRHEERHEIEEVIEQWRQAILHADVAALDALLDEDYMVINASGMIKTKEQTLDALRSGKMHIASLSLFDRRVRFYAKTALVTGRIEAVGSTNEGDMTGNYRYTQVFVRDQHGKWKIASFEINRIREPRDHHEHELEPTGR